MTSPPVRSPEWFQFYNGSFRAGVHELLVWGYQDVRHKIGPSSEEEEITGHIVEAIKDRLDDPATPSGYTLFYGIDDESHVRHSSRTGRRRQKLDIVIQCNLILPRPEFIFEAKLLRKNAFPISRYTGSGGMLCFIRGEYAAKYDAAAMIGYVQSDDPSRWYEELERSFSEDATGDLRVVSPLRKVSVHPALTDEWMSQHSRHENTNIVLFHIFLVCT